MSNGDSIISLFGGTFRIAFALKEAASLFADASIDRKRLQTACVWGRHNRRARGEQAITIARLRKRRRFIKRLRRSVKALIAADPVTASAVLSSWARAGK